MIRRLLIALVVASSGLAPSHARGQAPGTPENLFLMADDGLIVVRLRVLVDRFDAHAVWRRSVQNVFAELDANGDGVLTPVESTSVAARDRLWMIGGGFFRRIESGLSTADTSPRDDKVTPEELFDFFRGLGAGPLTLQTTRASPVYSATLRSGRSASAESWRRIDSDRDGELTAEEFRLGWQASIKLDRDDDETISAAELLSLDNPLARGPLQPVLVNPPLLASISAAGSDRDLATRVLARYDGLGDVAASREGKLSPAELGVAPEVIGAFDGDGDGLLDFAELRRFVVDPPTSVEIVVRLGNVEEAKPQLEVVNIADKRLESRASPEALWLARGSQHLDIAANILSPADPRPRYERDFARADADNNGYLDRNEAARLGELAPLFNILDLDGDGQIVREELLTFGERQMEFARTRVTLMAVERGRDLFQMLDANRDGRLGEREIRAGANFVSRFDKSGNGRLAPRELPSHVMLTVELGSPSAVREIVTGAPGADNAPPQTLGGPRWLERMDKNRDGEISRREFLGPPVRFRELDSNHDGAIDVREAAAAK